MHSLTLFLPTLGALVSMIIGEPIGRHERQASHSALPPSRDPWYTAPTGYASAAPGTILRIRTDPSNITAVVSASAAYNILFATTDTKYQPSWAVTTLLVPENPVDFEGPKASFALGPQEGHAVLDSVHAALSSQPFHSSPENTRLAMWGYSGGSIASTFAAELQASYAPELEFSDIRAIQHNGFSGCIAHTFAESNVYYAPLNISEYFVNGIEAVASAPELSRALGSNSFQGFHGIPQMPTFAYKAVNDEINGIASSDALIARYCSVGANILYNRNLVGAHLDESANGQPRARAFLADVFSGIQPQNLTTTGCTWVDVSINVTAITGE
ncbi:LIP-domain-containing protein [Xylariaceae sp. FL0255]|nr:LIP-domain-containing protein [Xylariaceae sp. FL0255]